MVKIHQDIWYVFITAQISFLTYFFFCWRLALSSCGCVRERELCVCERERERTLLVGHPL